MKTWLRSNLIFKLISLLLAVITWVYVKGVGGW